MVCHRGGFFGSATVLEIGRNPRRSKRVVPNLRRDIDRRGAPADHGIGIRLGQGGFRQLGRASADRPEQRLLRIAGESAAVNVRAQPSM